MLFWWNIPYRPCPTFWEHRKCWIIQTDLRRPRERRTHDRKQQEIWVQSALISEDYSLNLTNIECRLGVKSGSPACAPECLLLGVKRTQIPENRISETQKFCNRKSRNPENDFAPPILVSERGQPNLTLGLSARFKNVLPERATVIFATDFVVQEHQSGP